MYVASYKGRVAGSDELARHWLQGVDGGGGIKILVKKKVCCL